MCHERLAISNFLYIMNYQYVATLDIYSVRLIVPFSQKKICLGGNCGGYWANDHSVYWVKMGNSSL